MMNMIWLVVIVLLWCAPHESNGQGGNIWMGGEDNVWSTMENWSLGFVPPNPTTHPYSGWDDPSGPFYPLSADPSDDFSEGINDVKLARDDTILLIDESVTHAKAYGVRVGNGGASNTLKITGGRLDIGIDPDVDSTVNAVGWHLQVGRGYPGFDNGPVNAEPKATVLMTGGVVNTNGLLIPEQFVNHDLSDPTDSAPLNGELIMSGGTINARWMNLGQLKGNGRAELSGDAVINLASNVEGNPNNGGHLEFNRNWFLNGLPVPSSGNVSLDIRDAAQINIFGHRSDLLSAPDGSEVGRYQGYVDTGQLTAWGGTAEPIITLEDNMISIRAPEIVADYNSDGAVNAADFTVWRDALGSHLVLNGENPSAATPGIVDQEDYQFWAAHFPRLGTSHVQQANPAPEPTGLMLGCLGLCIIVMLQQRSSRSFNWNGIRL